MGDNHELSIEIGAQVASTTAKIQELAKSIRSIKTAISGTKRELDKLGSANISNLMDKFDLIATASNGLATNLKKNQEYFREFNQAVKGARIVSTFEKTNAQLAQMSARIDLINQKTQTENLRTQKQAVLLEKSKLSLDKMKNSAESGSKSMKKLLDAGKIYAIWNLTKKLRTAFGEALRNSISFVETANLFEKSMGSYSTSAYNFVYRVADAFGIATETLMQYQATFNNIMKSLGNISQETAYDLSKTLTQMAIDYSSLYNFSIESSMEKFQSALVGLIIVWLTIVKNLLKCWKPLRVQTTKV